MKTGGRRVRKRQTAKEVRRRFFYDFWFIFVVDFWLIFVGLLVCWFGFLVCLCVFPCVSCLFSIFLREDTRGLETRRLWLPRPGFASPSAWILGNCGAFPRGLLGIMNFI